MAETLQAKNFLDYAGTSYLWQQIVNELKKKQNTGDYATNERVKGAEDRVLALEGKHVTGKTVAEEAADAISALNLPNTYAGKGYETKVDTLIGEDTNKSARTIAAEELAVQLVPSNAKEALDTLGEIAAWIQAHPDDAAALNNRISTLEGKMVLGTYVPGEGEDPVQYATVKAYVEGYVGAAVAAMHTHSNQAVLDGITSTLIANWNDAYSKAHTHANKDVLDGISANDIAAWNAAEANAKAYADGAALAVYGAITGLSTAQIDAAILAGETAANA